MDEPDFIYIQRLVEQSSGIVLEKGKQYLAELRLTPLARETGHGSLHDLIAALRRHTAPTELHAQVVEAMTTNETTFFRDIQPFEILKTMILPTLIKNRAAERKLSIWCAASSNGQEPYSIAMLMREHFPQLATWHVEILASDISKKALVRAAEGLYSALEMNRGLPAVYREKYFDKREAGWQVKEEIRRMVDFRPINLIHEWPKLSPRDVIFIRNVMIYFDVPSKRRILEGMARLLRSDGFMFLGGAETTLGLSTAFERVPVSLTSCFRPMITAAAA